MTMDDVTRKRLDGIRAQAEFETDGFFATTDGRDWPPAEPVPQIITYYRECPPRLAIKPATIVERADVLWLVAEVERLTALVSE